MPPTDIIEIEGVQVDQDNPEFHLALDIIQNTSQHLYLTGKAGAGKTFFLRYLSQVCTKKMVVVAPTGVAAVKAGGVTLHSQFSIGPPYVYPPDDERLRVTGEPNIYSAFMLNTEKLDVIKQLDLLVIDEVSMVRADVIDVIDRILQVRRGNFGVPFGGVQVLFIGDAFQLPPITNGPQREILSKHYHNYFFFGSKAWSQAIPVCLELTKIYRQNNPKFIKILNNLRTGTEVATHLENINTRYVQDIDNVDQTGYIELCTKNPPADHKNSIELSKIDEPSIFFEAKVTDDFPVKSFPAERIVELKIGAQVMFLKNDFVNNIFNGLIGKVIEIKNDGDIEITVQLPDGTTRATGLALWHNYEYRRDPETGKLKNEIIGTFQQVPFRLAWAITVHKSQGLTFEKMVVSVSDAWDPGQVYVALSRATSIEGIMLRETIPVGAVHTSPAVLGFSGAMDLENVKADVKARHQAANLYYLAWQAGLAHDLKNAILFVKQANHLHDLSGTKRYKRAVSLVQSKILWQKERSDSDLNKSATLQEELVGLQQELKVNRKNEATLKTDLLELRKEHAESYKLASDAMRELKEYKSRGWWQRVFFGG